MFVLFAALQTGFAQASDVTNKVVINKALLVDPSPMGEGLYSRKGADTCLKCHDEDYKYPIYPVFFSKHGDRNDKRTPMAQLQCESCHGPGRAHATEP